MSVTLFGTETNGILPQGDFSANQNENAGWTASQSFLVKKGDLDRAIADYSKAIQLDPNYADAYAFRSKAYRKRGDKDRGMADIIRAAELVKQQSNDPNE